jgi:dTDP-4-dehydrorhamnose reductase
MSRVLVLGAAGMLGHKMLQTLMSGGHEVVGTIRGDLDDLGVVGEFLLSTAPIIDGIDVTDMESVGSAIDETDPQVVVNCVGVIKQLPIAKDSLTSIAINALFPHQLASVCAESGRRMIHFSTDCVFSGRQGSYGENDVSDATDLYGRTKFLGEVHDNALTLRTSIVGRQLSVFLSLLEWFIAQDGGTVVGFQKAMFSGVTTLHAARNVSRLINEFPDLSGLYQLAGPAISKYDLLGEFRDIMDLDVEIVPETGFMLDRTFTGDRFVAATNLVTPSWSDMITEIAEDPTPYEEMR